MKKFSIIFLIFLFLLVLYFVSSNTASFVGFHDTSSKTGTESGKSNRTSTETGKWHLVGRVEILNGRIINIRYEK